MRQLVVLLGILLVGPLPTYASDKKDIEKWAKAREAVCLPVRTTPGGQFYERTIWQDNDTDVAKLKDARTLKPEEGKLLLEFKRDIQPCRAAWLGGLARWWPREVPIRQSLYSRNDELIMKLATGEIPVGQANRLFIESRARFENELAVTRARSAEEAAAAQEAARARMAEAVRRAAEAMQQPTTETTTCQWLGNQLQCSTTRK